VSRLKQELYRFYAPFYKNWIMAKRNAFTIFEVIFWPFIGLMSIGLLASFLKLDESLVAFILTGAIAFSILQVCQIDVAYVMLFDMWSKSLKHTFVAPVRGYHLVFGSLGFGILRSTLVFILLAVLSRYLFGFDFLKAGAVPLLLFLAGIFVSAGLIGIVVCISILTFGQRAEVAAWTLSGIMMFVCGIYYPVETLPAPFLMIARAIPLTYFLEYFRSFYGYPGENVLFGFALAAVYFVIGLFMLELAVERARRTGIMLRLSE